MQGFNMGRRHAPSDLDPALRSTPQTQSQSKRLKPTPTAPTIRFEMPFAIWCSTCPVQSPSSLIGQGVRFNALKKRVGAYHSSPIWSFTIKHAVCGGRIEVRTDPANSDFVVAEGGRRRDYGDDADVAARTGGVVLETGGLGAAVRKAEGDDPFAEFEGRKGREVEEKDEAKRLEKLRSMQQRDWKNPGDVNKRLRAAFREGRRWRDGQRESGERLAEDYGFGFEILEGVAQDDVVAKGIEFGDADEEDVQGRALFTVSQQKDRATKGDRLRRKMVANTRTAMDPFGMDPDVKGRPAIRGLKRKTLPQDKEHEAGASKTEQSTLESTQELHVTKVAADAVHPAPSTKSGLRNALVDYNDSGSELEV